MHAFTLFAAATAIAVAATDDWGLNAPTLLALAGVLGVATQAVLSRFWVVPMSDEMIAWSESPGRLGAIPASVDRPPCRAGAIEAFVCYLLSALLS
jgi:hypothetical protein